jgi:hypothetical protein
MTKSSFCHASPDALRLAYKPILKMIGQALRKAKARHAAKASADGALVTACDVCTDDDGATKTVFQGVAEYRGSARVKCEVCEHLDRWDIERLLLQSESISLTAAKYGVDPMVIVRHDANHTAHPVKDLVRDLERAATLLEEACAPVLALSARHTDPRDRKTPTIAAVRNATTQQAEAARIRLKLFELRGGAMTTAIIARHPHFKAIMKAISDKLADEKHGPDYAALNDVVDELVRADDQAE